MPYAHRFNDIDGRIALAVHRDGFVETFGPTNRGGFTRDGGLFIRMINKTGAASKLGQLVTLGSEQFSVREVQAGIPNAVGAIQDAGVADGGTVRVVVSGIGFVLFEDGQAPTVGYWCGSSAAVNGRAEARSTLPDNSGAGVDIHNREIGHIVDTVAAGTDVVARVLFHFN